MQKKFEIYVYSKVTGIKIKSDLVKSTRCAGVKEQKRIQRKRIIGVLQNKLVLSKEVAFNPPPFWQKPATVKFQHVIQTNK